MLRHCGDLFPAFRDENFVSKRQGQVIYWVGFTSKKNGFSTLFLSIVTCPSVNKQLNK